MWDSFTSGILLSRIWHGYDNIEDNDFAKLKYRYITIVTSNKPYGIHDGSNPFFDNQTTPKFQLRKGGVHSGHVQTGIQDPFRLAPNGKGNCRDGYTKEVTASEGVRVLVAEKAKPNKDINSSLDREYFISFLNALNSQHQTAKFNIKIVPFYKESLFKPHPKGRMSGKPMILDLDMSLGDFVTLFYFDILVGLGELFALGQAYPSFNSTGDCKYRKAIPRGSGGYIDTDTLFGLARDLPCSPRRYTAHNGMKYGVPRDTKHPDERTSRKEREELVVFRQLEDRHCNKVLESFKENHPSFYSLPKSKRPNMSHNFLYTCSKALELVHCSKPKW